MLSGAVAATPFNTGNQGVCLWGIRVQDLRHNDPPVIRAVNETPLNCVLSATGLYLSHAHPADLFRHYARSPEEHNQTQIQILTIRVHIDIVSLQRKGVGSAFVRTDTLPPKGHPLNWEID